MSSDRVRQYGARPHRGGGEKPVGTSPAAYPDQLDPAVRLPGPSRESAEPRRSRTGLSEFLIANAQCDDDGAGDRPQDMNPTCLRPLVSITTAVLSAVSAARRETIAWYEVSPTSVRKMVDTRCEASSWQCISSRRSDGRWTHQNAE